MKSKILLALLVCFAFSARVSAQCYAHLNYSQNPNSTSIGFWADSVVGSSALGSAIFTWSFGDGTGGAGQQISHTFSLGGVTTRTFTVCLTMFDTASNCRYTTCDTITVTNGSSHTCTTTVASTNVDSLYSFTAACTGTGTLTYSWTDNGVVFSTAASPSLVITYGGGSLNHNICVTITDSLGCVSSDCFMIIDSMHNTCYSYASFTNVDSIYTFTASHVGAAPVSYTWTYGNIIICSCASPSYVLNASDLLRGATICVVITDANGCTSTDCVTITGTPAGGNTGCQAYFNIVPDSINALGGYYVGYNLSTGSYGSNILWSFGDGTTSTSAYPSHTYASPGMYIVCLTVGVAGTTCYDTYCDSSFYAFKTNPGLMTHLAFAAPAGINEASAANAIQVYPNPANNVLKINTDQKVESVRILNIEGQIIYEAKSIGNEVNISKLSQGIYILEVSYLNTTAHTKFVKE